MTNGIVDFALFQHARDGEGRKIFFKTNAPKMPSKHINIRLYQCDRRLPNKMKY